jgi:hypothetical protein
VLIAPNSSTGRAVRPASFESGASRRNGSARLDEPVVRRADSLDDEHAGRQARRRAPGLEQEGPRITRFAVGSSGSETRATRPSFIECGVPQGVIASRAGAARLAARAAPALRHAANDP